MTRAFYRTTRAFYRTTRAFYRTTREAWWPPLDAPDASGTSAVERRWITFFLVLGLAARSARFFLRFPLWEDECFLAISFIDRGFAELWLPLGHHQVAPPLFLFIELALVRSLGFTEWTLRLFSFVSSVAGLLLFRAVAARWLKGLALVLAVGAFSVSYPAVRYAAEAKPYGSDALVSLILLALFTPALSGPGRTRALGLLALLLPFLIGLSYPAVFVAGGATLVAAAVYRRERAPVRDWIRLLACGTSLALAFAGWTLLVAGPQRAAEASFMEVGWQGAFPPVEEPWRLPLWLVATHASDFLAYPVGGPRFASTASFLLCLAGLDQLVRVRDGRLLGLSVAPVSLHLLASAFHRYPYGGHARLSLYASPLICCLIGLGAARVVGWLTAREAAGRGALLAVLTAIGVLTIARDVRFPYKTMSDQRARAFAQWYWTSAVTKEEVACVRRDLGVDLAPGTFEELSWSAEYVCNRRIYAPAGNRGGPDLARVAPGRPLVCLVYRDPRFPLDVAAFERWMSAMRSRYDLAGREVFAFPRYDKRERTLLQVDTLEAYRFTVRAPVD